MASKTDTCCETTPVPPRCRRRWLRFSLRTLLLLVLILGVGLGWLGNVIIRVRHQRQIVAGIGAAGGQVAYDYRRYLGLIGDHHNYSPPPGPKFINVLFGNDVFAYVDGVYISGPRVTDADLLCLAELPRLQEL